MSSRTHAGPRAIVAGLLAGGLWLFVPASAAEDVVYLKPRQGGGPSLRLTGQIVDYTARELVLKSATGRQKSIPASQVERVETTYSPQQTAGDRAFARHDFRQAIEEYRQALSAMREPRDWVRRRILAQIVWCHRNLGQHDQAGEYFLILFSRDPDTQDFDCIPLAWIDETPSPAVAQKAESWLADAGNPAASLMGASHLLFTDRRAAAIQQLDRLATSRDPRIAWLAQAQLWRTAAATATGEQLHQWSEAIAAADPSLRAGAYFVVGLALAGHQPEEAALALMRLPIVYPREYRLAAAALLTSGECLEKLDRKAQAATLYRELARRYGGAPEASRARRKLETLASTAPARDN